MEDTARDHTISDFQLRLMKDSELEETFRLVDSEDGWSLTLSALKKIKEVFDSIYVVVNSEGEIAGTLSILPSHNGECVLGNFVVASKYRGKGLGRKVISEIQCMYAGQIVTLVSSSGVPGFYSKCGLQSVGPVRSEIHMEANTADIENKLCQYEEILVKSYTPDNFEELCQYDRSLRGYDMSKYLSVMVKTFHLFVAHSKSNGKMTGYAAGYQKRSTVIVNGCYADNDDIALHLFWNILQMHPERSNVIVKLQTIKPRIFLTTFGKLSSSTWDNCVRFANGNALPTSLQKLYAATDCDYTA